MSENFTGVVDHSQDDLDLQSQLLERAEHFARYRRLAWWMGLGGIAAQALGFSVLLAAVPLDAAPGVAPQANPLVVGLASLLNIAGEIAIVACISLAAVSRGRSWAWGLLAVTCSCALPLLLLVVFEDFGYGPARAKLEQYGTVGIPASRPAGAAIGLFVAFTLIFSGIGLARFGKNLGGAISRFQQQAKKSLPTSGATAEAAPQDVDAEPLPDIAKRPCKVASTPAGAAILLDGEPTGKTTPATITIWAGRDQKVRVELEGHAPADKDVFVGLQDSPELSFDLVAYPKIEVTSEPAGAEVYAGGKLVVAATPGSFFLEDAAAPMVVKKRGFTEVSVKVNDKIASISAQLLPAFYVTVESKPEGAEVLLDGAKTGLKTPVELAVAAGKRHEIQLEHDGVTTPKTRLKPLKAGATTKVSIDLVATQKSELTARIRKLSAELAKANATLRKLEARETGFAETAAIERKRAAELENAQQKVDELTTELDTVREDLAAMQ